MFISSMSMLDLLANKDAVLIFGQRWSKLSFNNPDLQILDKNSTLQKAILIGHKQNQESDFNYLSENDNFDI